MSSATAIATCSSTRAGTAAGRRAPMPSGFRAGVLDPGWQWPYDGPPRLRVARGVLRIVSGSLSRAWAPRDFTMQARVAGGGDLAVLLTGGRPIAVRAGAGGAVLVSGRRI